MTIFKTIKTPLKPKNPSFQSRTAINVCLCFLVATLCLFVLTFNRSTPTPVNLKVDNSQFYIEIAKSEKRHSDLVIGLTRENAALQTELDQYKERLRLANGSLAYYRAKPTSR